MSQPVELIVDVNNATIARNGTEFRINPRIHYRYTEQEQIRRFYQHTYGLYFGALAIAGVDPGQTVSFPNIFPFAPHVSGGSPIRVVSHVSRIAKYLDRSQVLSGLAEFIPSGKQGNHTLVTRIGDFSVALAAQPMVSLIDVNPCITDISHLPLAPVELQSL